MNYKIDDTKFNMYLDELSKEYKELLLKRLLADNIGFDEINISELIRLDTQCKEQLLIDKSKQNRKRTRLMYIGVLYSFFGMIIYFYFSYDFSRLNIEDLLPLTGIFISLIGVIAIALAVVNPYNQKNRLNGRRINNSSDEFDSKTIEYLIISTWREIEGIANDLASNIGIKDLMPGKTIRMLKQEGFINESEEIILKSLFSLRNSIVHFSPENSKDRFSDDKNRILNESRLIIDKLRKIF